jgi:malate synthase
MVADTPPEGVAVLGELSPGFSEVLTSDALALVADLERRFGDRRRQLLSRRAEVQRRIDAGEDPDFPTETADIRAADWKVEPVPEVLLDRRVEITVPSTGR